MTDSSPRRWLLLALALAVGATSLGIVGCRAGRGGAGDASAIKAGQGAGPYDRPGYVAYARRGQLWVFEADSDARARFLRDGEPRRSVTVVGAGPHAMDVRSVDRRTIDGYLAADAR